MLICLRWLSKGVFAFPRTQGFENKALRDKHHWKHWDDFSSLTISVERYEYLADRFLSRIQAINRVRLPNAKRAMNDVVRYDPVNNVLGIIRSDGIIETFFKPEFCRNVPMALRNRKQCHNQRTHFDYAMKICAQ
jgi:pyocin large subunit-like protein